MMTWGTIRLYVAQATMAVFISCFCATRRTLRHIQAEDARKSFLPLTLPVDRRRSSSFWERLESKRLPDGETKSRRVQLTTPLLRGNNGVARK